VSEEELRKEAVRRRQSGESAEEVAVNQHPPMIMTRLHKTSTDAPRLQPASIPAQEFPISISTNCANYTDRYFSPCHFVSDGSLPSSWIFRSSS